MSEGRALRVVRNGTAIEIESPAGTALVRGFQLARQIGAIGWGEIASAAFTGDPAVIEIELEGRGHHSYHHAYHLDASATAAAPPASIVIRGARLMTCDGDPSDPLEVIEDGALICAGGSIAWRGRSSELGQCGLDLDAASMIDVGGALVSPGLIDCHTHLIFGGARDGEFALRAGGASYQEIAAAGGGIASSRAATREIGPAEHIALATSRLESALAAGTTTMEAKSGYALTAKEELEVLEITQALDSLHLVDLVPTLLGAHVVPAEMRDDRAAYVRSVITEMIPPAAARKLCTSVDVYCDEGAFTLAETREILEAARESGLEVRGHVGQFADLGGPQLLAELGALSADHLEEISPSGIAALAGGGVVGVMLPTACVQLRQAPPPIEALRAAGVALAVASDMNPGSSYCESLTVPMWLATTHYGMTVEETWLGVTRHAARALGRHDIGTLTVGASADLIVWDCERPSEVPYRIGKNQVARVIKGGWLAG